MRANWRSWPRSTVTFLHTAPSSSCSRRPCRNFRTSATARQVGHDVGLVDVSPDDLYDPRVIIRLGAKYVSDLAGKLGGNRYRVAAAYNAGPKQVALWSRLAPADGDDFFLSSINFDET